MQNFLQILQIFFKIEGEIILSMLLPFGKLVKPAYFDAGSKIP